MRRGLVADYDNRDFKDELYYDYQGTISRTTVMTETA